MVRRRASPTYAFCTYSANFEGGGSVCIPALTRSSPKQRIKKEKNKRRAARNNAVTWGKPGEEKISPTRSRYFLRPILPRAAEGEGEGGEARGSDIFGMEHIRYRCGGVRRRAPREAKMEARSGARSGHDRTCLPPSSVLARCKIGCRFSRFENWLKVEKNVAWLRSKEF